MTQAGGSAVSAAHVAVAIVSAAKITGVDPARVFEAGRGHQKTLIMAAAGVCARLGLSKAQAGKLFRVTPQRLAPSMLVKEKIATEQLLEIAEALEASGLTEGDDAHARWKAPWGPTPARTDSVWVKPKSQAAVIAGDAATAPVELVHEAGERPLRSAVRASLKAVQPPKRDALRRIPGLKPVSEDIVRWAGYFLEARWRLPEVADLFEVCPVALLDVLDPVGARA